MPRTIAYRPLDGDGVIYVDTALREWSHTVVHQAGPIMIPGPVRTRYYRFPGGHLVEAALVFKPFQKPFPDWMRDPRYAFAEDRWEYFIDDDEVVHYHLQYPGGGAAEGSNDDLEERVVEVSEARLRELGIRVPAGMTSPRQASNGGPRPPSPDGHVQPPENEARDAYIYGRYQQKVPLKNIVAEVNATPGWNHFRNPERERRIDAAFQALHRHCKRLGLPPPRRRPRKSDATRRRNPSSSVD
jgi:hypothetical protein